MTVTVKLFASLRTGRFEVESRRYEPGSTVDSIRRSLKIPKKEAAITFVNGIHAEPGQELKEGDVLAFFPPSGGG